MSWYQNWNENCILLTYLFQNYVLYLKFKKLSNLCELTVSTLASLIHHLAKRLTKKLKNLLYLGVPKREIGLNSIVFRKLFRLEMVTFCFFLMLLSHFLIQRFHGLEYRIKNNYSFRYLSYGKWYFTNEVEFGNN